MNTTTVLLIVHGLLAVALLGAITHQAVSVWAPARKPAASFVARFRGVSGAFYTNGIVVLYVLTAILGGVIYAEYRLAVRVVLEELALWPYHGAFELKEHFSVVGLAILPAYWYFWQRDQTSRENTRTRAVLTSLLAFIVWWSFLVGHVLNNIRGFGS